MVAFNKVNQETSAESDDNGSSETQQASTELGNVKGTKEGNNVEYVQTPENIEWNKLHQVGVFHNNKGAGFLKFNGDNKSLFLTSPELIMFTNPITSKDGKLSLSIMFKGDKAGSHARGRYEVSKRISLDKLKLIKVELSYAGSSVTLTEELIAEAF